MTLGLVGRKVGMTRVFTDDGDSLPVTVLDVSDNRVTQVKTAATDGYSAVQVTFGKRRASRVSKAAASDGKGFAGLSKRHHFPSNRASHGNSISHNKPGSTGMAQDPGRVFPGKRMAGHLGAVQRTVQGLEVVRVDAERQLLLVKGSVPGSRGRDIVVRPTSKAIRAKGRSPRAAPSKAAPAAAQSAKAAPAAAQAAKAPQAAPPAAKAA